MRTEIAEAVVRGVPCHLETGRFAVGEEWRKIHRWGQHFCPGQGQDVSRPDGDVLKGNSKP